MFRGHDVQIDEGVQVYEPSTKTWAPIPGSRVVADAINSGLALLCAYFVLGKEIILRGPRKGIAFNVMSNFWTLVSENLTKGWWKCITATVMKNMLITCHVEYDIQFSKSMRNFREQLGPILCCNPGFTYQR